MQTIGIVCAVDRELAPYLTAIQNDTTSSKVMLTFHEGFIEGVKVVAAACGVCKVNAAIATQILIDSYHADAVIMSGTAGGIDNRLKVGDTVIATETCYHDMAMGILMYCHPYMTSEYFVPDETLLARCRESILPANGAQIYYGRIATGDAFIDMDGREKIIEEHQPLCVDMETAGVAHVCYVNNVPFIAVRSISDTADESGAAVFDENCDYAAEQSFHVVKQLLAQIKKDY